MTKTFTLHKPILVGEEIVKEITVDLDKLTGADMIAVEREFMITEQNEHITLKELNKEYQTLVAARAAGLHVSVFDQISAKDFIDITRYVMGFFIGLDLHEAIEEAIL